MKRNQPCFYDPLAGKDEALGRGFDDIDVLEFGQGSTCTTGQA
jgi:hypothetical protein